MTVRVTVDGLDEAIDGLDRGADAARAAASEATGRGASRVAARARQVAPRQTGKLIGTIRAERTPGGSYVVKAGGPGVEYAAIVHEDLTAIHPDGQAKFIERPAIAEAATIEGDIDAAVTQALESTL